MIAKLSDNTKVWLTTSLASFLLVLFIQSGNRSLLTRTGEALAWTAMAFLISLFLVQVVLDVKSTFTNYKKVESHDFSEFGIDDERATRAFLDYRNHILGQNDTSPEAVRDLWDLVYKDTDQWLFGFSNKEGRWTQLLYRRDHLFLDVSYHSSKSDS